MLREEVPEGLLAAAAVEDPVGARALAGVAAEAFVRLPARWRMVLWHTEIESESPTVLARPALGDDGNVDHRQFPTPPPAQTIQRGPRKRPLVLSALK